MEGYGPSTYGDRWADIYDEWTDQRIGASTQATIDGLADLAAGGRVLELAIGTGRIALGLVERGLEVHGIDASEAMVAGLRDKPGATRSRSRSATSPTWMSTGGSISSSWRSTRSSR